MKKLFLLAVLTLSIGLSSFSQYFQGSFTNVGNNVIFKMKPTGNITTSISYIEAAFRYKTATTPAFTVGNLTSNTVTFPSLNIQRLPDYNDGTYTYIKFVHNTGTIASASYTAGTEYVIFGITLDGSTALANLEMVSDLVSGNYVFGVVDGGGNQIDPGAGQVLYGPGLNSPGDILPLNNVPVPVKFSGFSVIKKDNTALINWQIENENANTDHYEIERSINGIAFSTIASIPAKNNGLSSNNYDMTDLNLSSVRSSGVIYYRIKQLDKDRKALYTETRSLRINAKGIIIQINPNPVKSIATLSLDLVDAAKVSVKISDASGKEVRGFEFNGTKGNNIQNVDMSSLGSGTYLMRVQAGNELQTLSIVKTKE